MSSAQKRALFIFAGVPLLLVACRREERAFRAAPLALERGSEVRLTDFQPGPAMPAAGLDNKYEDNAYALSEGKRLFHAFNCSGCHGNGGGNIGPALLDSQWRYGGNPGQIFASIMQGRPNGMPSFAGKLSPNQAWQLAAYVRSLGGNAPIDAATGCSDAMKSNPPENSADRAPPQNPESPRSAQQPD